MVVRDVADDDRLGRKMAERMGRRDRLAERVTVRRARTALPLSHPSLPDCALDVQEDDVGVGDEGTKGGEECSRLGRESVYGAELLRRGAGPHRIEVRAEGDVTAGAERNAIRIAGPWSVDGRCQTRPGAIA